MSENKKYTAQVTLVMGTVEDPKQVLKGSFVSLGDAEAEDLLEKGYIVASDNSFDGPEPTLSAKEPPKGKDLEDAITLAVTQLDPDEDFTGDGKPSVKSLALVLGFAINAKDRDDWFVATQSIGE